MSHLRAADGTVLCEHEDEHEHDHKHREHEHRHDDEHGHSHGLVDRSILRSRAGVKSVSASLLILGVTAGAQVAIFVFSHSVALLADLIHNTGDALTAVPLGIAFFLCGVSAVSASPGSRSSSRSSSPPASHCTRRSCASSILKISPISGCSPPRA